MNLVIQSRVLVGKGHVASFLGDTKSAIELTEKALEFQRELNKPELEMKTLDKIVTYYEMIEDEKRDIGPILQARENFEYILENYPNTDFAIDAKFKLDYIKDMLASKEMYVGRHYQKKNKWIAAINRFKV